MIIDINCASDIVPAAPSFRSFDQRNWSWVDLIRFRVIFTSLTRRRRTTMTELGLIFHENQSDFCWWHPPFDTAIRSHSFWHITNGGWTFDQKFFLLLLLSAVFFPLVLIPPSASYVHIYSSYSTVRTHTHTYIHQPSTQLFFFPAGVCPSLLFFHLSVLWFSLVDLQRSIKNQHPFQSVFSNSEGCSQ